MNTIKYISYDDSSIRDEEGVYFIRNYLTYKDSPDISIAVSELHGAISKTIKTITDRMYYFIEGAGSFIFDDKTVTVNSPSVLFIPKNTSYSMRGDFKAVLINTPAFQPQTKPVK